MGQYYLPDKVFRYLRTVIVTAAVYWCFNSMPDLAISHLLLTFQHWAGVRHYTSSYEFAVPCVFVKQSLEPDHCDPITLQTLSPTRYQGTSSPEVTRLFCRVP